MINLQPLHSYEETLLLLDPFGFRTGTKAADGVLNVSGLSSELPGDVGLEAVVDGYTPPAVQLNAHSLQTQVLGIWSSADADQQHVAGKRLVLPSSCSLHSETSNPSD